MLRKSKNQSKTKRVRSETPRPERHQRNGNASDDAHAVQTAQRGWANVKTCPVCNKNDWCSATLDGQLICCRRQEDGCCHAGTDINGSPYYLHRCNSDGKLEYVGSASRTGGPRLHPNKLRFVYENLLSTLGLSDEHREQLKKRGLSNTEIDQRQYASLPPKGRRRIVRQLLRHLDPEGDKNPKDLLLVPGFVLRGEGGDKYLTLAGSAGLLIPVRDDHTRIVAIKIRRDEPGDGSKYIWLSSARDGGPGPGSPVHIPLHSPTQDQLRAGYFDQIRFTEGELKADVATALCDTCLTISAPGATNWRVALEVAKLWRYQTVRLAFDGDASVKPTVAGAQLACAKAIQEAGMQLVLETWDPENKGIDDLLVAGKAPKELTGEAAMAVITKMATEARGEKEDHETGSSEVEDDKKSQSKLIVELVRSAGIELWHTPGGDAYVTLPADSHHASWTIRSQAFRRWISHLFYKTYGKVPGSQAFQDAKHVLEAMADDGVEHPVFIRLAEHQNKIYLDICNKLWRAVEIDSRGWRVIEKPPVKFRRVKAMLPLPIPERGSSLEELRSFVNTTDEDWHLLVAWLLAALFPRKPYPLLCVHGEQGSAKSTLARVLRSLVDPNVSPVRAEPRDTRDLAIVANNGWVIAIDNLSYLSPQMSDALCRLSTGGGFSTRTLYQDDEETIFDAQRPIVLNGIEELATRGDLLDRAMLLSLPKIDADKRRTEKRFWKRFDKLRPSILGALLDVVSRGLRNLPRVKLDSYPRMADFVQWITACEPALGWQPGTFLAVYEGNLLSANESILESSPLVEYLRKLIADDDTWTGTASEMLESLNKIAPDNVKTLRLWPKTPRALSGAIRRLAPNLRQDGLKVDCERQSGGSRRRLITLGQLSNQPSLPSPPSQCGGITGFDRDDRDGSRIRPSRQEPRYSSIRGR